MNGSVIGHPRSYLVVSPHFPPARAARGLQVAKLVKQLALGGACVDVLGQHTGDEDDWFTPPEGVSVHWPGGVQSKRQLSSASWAVLACIQGGRRLKAAPANRRWCIVSTSMPVSAHLAGLLLKLTHPRLPWIAHFSDPWANSPYLGASGAVVRTARRWFEAAVLRSADCLLFPSAAVRDHVLAGHPGCRTRAEVLPHAYDLDLYARQIQRADDGLFRLLYAGGFDTIRTCEPLLEVLRGVVRLGGPIERLRLQLIGEGHAATVRQLEAVRSGIVEHIGAVSYPQSLEAMQRADCLLCIDANLSESPFFPSKLADYFGSGRPVVAISPRGSCTTSMLQGLGLPVYGYDALDECARWLSRALSGDRPLPTPVGVQNYAAPIVARRFNDIVEALYPAGKAQA